MKINQLKGGAALSYVTIFLTNIVGLVLTPFIIRSLGSAEYGLYTMIGALVGYMSVLDFGLNKTIVRFVAKYKAESDKKGQENFLAHGFIMYSCIALVVIIFGSLLYLNLDSLYKESLDADQLKKAKTMMLILIFNLAVSLPGGAFTGICYGHEQFILPKITNIIRYIIRSILVVVILLLGGDSIGLVVLDTLMNLFIILINAYIVFKILKVKIRLHNFDKKLFSNVLGFSLWIFVFAIVYQLRWQVGQFIIGVFYSTSVVAIYAVGLTLGNYFGAFSSAISSVFLPRAIQMTVKNIPSEELTNTFIKISRIILIVLLYILGGFIILGKDFIYYWVGEEYYLSYYYSIIIMIGLTPILSQGFANNVLEAKNLLAYRGRLLLSLTIFGTILSVFAVKNYGVMEMIVVTVLFMLAERVFMIPFYIKKANLNMARYYKEILPLLFYGIIVAIVFLIKTGFFPERNLFVIFFSLVGYTILYAMTSILLATEYERQLFKSVVDRLLITVIRKKA